MTCNLAHARERETRSLIGKRSRGRGFESLSGLLGMLLGMYMYNYEELLERAYKNMPESVHKDVRFEVPNLVSMITGNRTFVKNFIEATKKIRREEKHVMKFLLKELGTQGYIEGQTLVLLGKFSNKMINDKFNKYVKEYVYCPICGKPDTHLVKEGRIMFIKCEACGAKNPVPNIK